MWIVRLQIFIFFILLNKTVNLYSITINTLDWVTCVLLIYFFDLNIHYSENNGFSGRFYFESQQKDLNNVLDLFEINKETLPGFHWLHFCLKVFSIISNSRLLSVNCCTECRFGILGRRIWFNFAIKKKNIRIDFLGFLGTIRLIITEN